MVAPRPTETERPTSATRGDRFAHLRTSVDFSDPNRGSQYAVPIDQTQARYDPDSAEIHVFDFHPVYQPKVRLSRQEQRELAIKQAALRIAAGLEMRSLREIAIEIGCKHTALDNAHLRLCKKLGLWKFHASNTTRRKQSEARLRQLKAGS